MVHRRSFSLAWAILLVWANACSAGAQPPSRDVRFFEPFDYQGVRLEDGPLLRQVLELREDYLRVPNDDYLKPFRQRAGLSAPGADLGGWYTSGIFHVFGQVLSGLARMHAATGDEACRQKLNTLIEGWSRCIEEDGYFFSSKPASPPHYIYEKMVGGLLDAHLYGHCPQALSLLDRITAWAERNLDHSNAYVFDTLTGITEWYTLSENLYRASSVTGQQRYRDYARTWEYTDFWRLFASSGQNLFGSSPGYHAYSHVNSLNGAIAAYVATGERPYLDSALRAYDYLQAHQVYTTGGYGPAERLVPDPLLVDYLDVMENHWETACCSWAGFKLCKRLMSITGEARFGDWIERLLINGIGATLPMDTQGRVMYYSGHGLGGGAKSHNMIPWSCCAGTRLQAVVDYHDLVFFKGPDALYVNLFTPATVVWNHRGQAVTLRQQTGFPETEKSTLRVSLPRRQVFTLQLRQPSWLANPMKVRINGASAETSGDSRGWRALRRTWRDGDLVEVDLPMRLAMERFPRASTNPFPAALVRGPVVLAARSLQGNPVALLDLAHLETSLLSVDGEPLTYRLVTAPDVLFRPFYRFKEDEPYYMYFDPQHPWTRRDPAELPSSGGWSLNLTGDLLTTTNIGSFLEYPFTGSRIRWVGRMFDDAGCCEVRIDDKALSVVDQYDSVRDRPFRYEITGLSEGRHTIRITLLPEKNPASKDRKANIGGFDIIVPVSPTQGTVPFKP